MTQKFTVHIAPDVEVDINPNSKLGGDSFTFFIEDNKDIEISDGYHTMHELYQHRMALNAALFNAIHELTFDPVDPPEQYTVIKSKLHNDGTMFEGGYFIVVFNNHKFGQISYHYKLKHWDLFKIPEVEKVPWAFDGHSSEDSLNRLLKMSLE